MSYSRSPDKDRRLRHTVDVVLAAALARQRLSAAEAAPPAPPLPVYEFTLLAAATTDVPQLPAGGWYDVRRYLHARTEVAADELRLTLQAQGFAALTEVAGKTARLSSDDGGIDLRCRFDGRGRALAVLANTAAVRAALRHFRVGLLPSEPQP